MRPTVHEPRVIIKLEEDSIAIKVNKLMEQSKSFRDEAIH